MDKNNMQQTDLTDSTPATNTSPRDGAKSEVKIRASNLDFFYGDNQALFDVSLDIERNKVFALIGPSGCGKSTFLRTLNRMNDTIPGTRLTGKITIDDIDIYRDVKDVSSIRTRVGTPLGRRYRYTLRSTMATTAASMIPAGIGRTNISFST